MRTLTLIATLLFTSTVYAQQAVRSIPVVCMHVHDFAHTMDTFNEVPMLRGNSVRMIDQGTADNVLVLFMNPNARTWTIAERVSEEVVCVVAVGEKLEPLTEDGSSLEEKYQGVVFK